MNPQLSQEVARYLADAIEDRLDNLDLSGEPVTADTRFEDLGMDSISLVELALLIENDLAVIVTDEQLIELGTIGATSDYIAGSLPDLSAWRLVRGGNAS